MRPWTVAALASVLPFGFYLVGQAGALDSAEPDYELKLLGKYVFFDKISTPERMACASCHDPDTGGTGSVSGVNLHQVAVTGANPHTVGNLKPPTNAYASFIPEFGECNRGGLRIGTRGVLYCGGNFWNGRAEGRDPALLSGATKHLGDEVFQGSTDARLLAYAKYFGPTSDQALNPMPNTVEQNIDRKSVCQHVASAAYAELYERAWGEPIDCSDRTVSVSADDVSPAVEAEFDISFKRLMLAVGAWQHSSELNSFSSKRDLALRAELACLEHSPDADPKVCTHPNYSGSPGRFPLVGFSAEENLGHDLFYNLGAFGPKPFPNLPATNCSLCHASDAQHPDGTGLFELYTDHAYHNIGTPVNPELAAAPDPGVSGHAQLPNIDPATGRLIAGGFKAPTLRNVDKRKGNGFTKAYGHNGWFKSLESIVHFYNTARVLPRCEGALTEREALAKKCWPAPEWPASMAPVFILGNLGLSQTQEAALVAYLKTLTDTQTPKAPNPYK
ncbi:MAG: cytochrome c peroxidase [Myxococcales bacterium]